MPSLPVGQNSNTALNLASAADSPTLRNTYANAFEAPPPTPSSAIRPSFRYHPSAPIVSSTASIPPFSRDLPYSLPIGTHSILRNSPLPRRHLSATSSRAPRRMFPPVKRVAFQEKLVEVIPIPVIEALSETSDAEFDAALTEDEHEQRRAMIEAEDGHAGPGQGRRKRRRDWVWRPLEDDTLPPHHFDKCIESKSEFNPNIPEKTQIETEPECKQPLPEQRPDASAT